MLNEWWHCTPTFNDQIFSRPFFVSFTDKFFCEFHWQFFLRWLHQNNLCRESIAQDCMWVMRVLRWLHLNNLTYFCETTRDRQLTNFLSVKVRWHDDDSQRSIPQKALTRFLLNFEFVNLNLYFHKNNSFYFKNLSILGLILVVSLQLTVNKSWRYLTRLIDF